MTKRVRYEVKPSSNGWDVTRDGTTVSHHRLKDRAVEAAAGSARREGHSQLMIKTEGGRIQDERTYGSDPFPPRG